MKKFLLFAIFVVINSSLFAASAKVLNLSEFKAKFYNGNVASPGFKKVTTKTILHIYADWCAPCRALGSKLDKFIDEKPDFKYYKFGESKNDTLGNAQKIKFLRQVIKCECYPLVTGRGVWHEMLGFGMSGTKNTGNSPVFLRTQTW